MQMQSKKVSLLLLGKSGDGKTAFVNLLYLISQNKPLGEIDHVCVETKFKKGIIQEGDPNNQAKSQTSEPRRLEFHLKIKDVHYDVAVIDTPGVFDTDSAKNSKHVDVILQKIANVELNGCLMLKNGNIVRRDVQQENSIEMMNQILGAEFKDSVVYLQTNKKVLNKEQMKSVGGTIENTFHYDNHLFAIDWNDPEYKIKSEKKFENLKAVVQQILEKLSKTKCNVKKKKVNNTTKFRIMLSDIVKDFKILYKKDREILQEMDQTGGPNGCQASAIENNKKKINISWRKLQSCICKMRKKNTETILFEEFNEFLRELSDEIDKISNKIINDSKNNLEMAGEIEILKKIKHDMENNFPDFLKNSLSSNLLSFKPLPYISQSSICDYLYYSFEVPKFSLSNKLDMVQIEYLWNEIKYNNQNDLFFQYINLIATILFPVQLIEFRIELSPIEELLCNILYYYLNSGQAQEINYDGLIEMTKAKLKEITLKKGHQIFIRPKILPSIGWSFRLTNTQISFVKKLARLYYEFEKSNTSMKTLKKNLIFFLEYQKS